MSDRDTTGSSFTASKRANSESAASSFQIPPRKNRSGTRSSPRATANANDDGERVSLDVKAGDTILFGKYAGQEIKLDGVEYVIMKEDDARDVATR
jgi:chaperonin GroES